MKIHVNEEDFEFIKESLISGEVLNEDLRRWFKEKWVDVSKKVDGKHPPCGRKDADGKSYPKCRPSKKMSKETPKVASSYSKKDKKAMTNQKRSAEKKEPKIGKGNKPTMTRFKEGVNEIKIDISTINKINFPSLFNENIKISNGLHFHIVNRKPLSECVYKNGSTSFYELLEESRDLYMNGDLELSNDDLRFIYENEYGPIEETDYVVNNLINEAEYQGRKVSLGKIMQGDIKKFKVYVKNEKGKVVKVNFGFGGKSAKGKRMTIKKNNPERRKSFRARHKCDTPGPRWKPRYWACRTW